MTETTFEYCILAAELGAAIQLHQQTINMSEQSRAADMAAKLQQFDAATGTSLASVYVPPPCKSSSAAASRIRPLISSSFMTKRVQPFRGRPSISRIAVRRSMWA